MRGWTTILAALAGLMGAAGVGLAAAGAHLTGSPIVTTAADFLLFHAGLVVALIALATASGRQGAILIAASLVALGSILFSGEITLHVLLDVQGLSKVAPVGGSLTILGWLVASVAMPLALRGPRPPC